MVENTDLSAVLSRLAQFSQPLPQHHSSSETNQHPPYLNSFATTGIPNVAADTSKKSSELQQLGKPLIDPATITTWQEGLRCVTKIAAENKSFAVRIRRMMQDQRAMEMKWYAERQDLKRVQAGRTQSSAQALEILKSLDPSRLNTASAPTISSETELAECDKRIYEAQRILYEGMSLEMKTLGVPYFGTPSSLIRAEQDSSEQHDLPIYSRPISSQQLLALQKRMVSHLEDLYRD